MMKSLKKTFDFIYVLICINIYTHTYILNQTLLISILSQP